MQWPNHGPFALLGTAAALGVGARAMKKVGPFQSHNGLPSQTSTILPASVSGAAVDLGSAEESSCSSTKCSSPFCAKCNPPFKLSQYLNAINVVVIMLFFGSTAMCTQYAVLANIEPAKIATFAVAVGSAMFGAASELFAVKGEVKEVRGDIREFRGDIKEGLKTTERLEQKVDKTEAKMESEFKDIKNEMKEFRYFLFASLLISSLSLLKRS